jgi:hypothetical protein
MLSSLLGSQGQGYGARGLMQPVGDVIKGPQNWYQQQVELGGNIARPIVPPMGIPGGGAQGVMQFRPRDTRSNAEKFQAALEAQNSPKKTMKPGDPKKYEQLFEDKIRAADAAAHAIPPDRGGKFKEGNYPISRPDREYLEELAVKRGITPNQLFQQFLAQWPQAWGKYQNPWEDE